MGLVPDRRTSKITITTAPDSSISHIMSFSVVAHIKSEAELRRKDKGRSPKISHIRIMGAVILKTRWEVIFFIWSFIKESACLIRRSIMPCKIACQIGDKAVRCSVKPGVPIGLKSDDPALI